MRGPVSFLLSVNGRAGRQAMLLITGVFLLLGLIRQGMGTLGSEIVQLLQLLILWPAWVAIPIRRFHDMNRRWWWALVFWGGAIFGLTVFVMVMNGEARALGLDPAIWLTDAQAFYDAKRAGWPEGLEWKPLSASALGGLSTAAIFLSIQFGWLHFIPGTRGENRFGPAPATTTR